MIDVLLDVLLDSLKMLPLIILTYVILDIYERNTDINAKINLILNSKTGPLFGALIGCVPQCGFAFMAATLFVHDLASAGTMVAVFIATSDEALPMLIANPGEYKNLLLFVIVKVVFAIIAGYLLDGIIALYRKMKYGKVTLEEDYEEDEEEEELTIADPTCVCGNTMLENVAYRTGRVMAFVVAINLIFSTLIYFIGEDSIVNFLQSTYTYQSFVTALVGFIPNCAVSIVLTELFLINGVSFGALIAGLSVNAGIGTMVLLKDGRSKLEKFGILGYMYVISVIAGIILTMIIH